MRGTGLRVVLCCATGALIAAAGCKGRPSPPKAAPAAERAAPARPERAVVRFKSSDGIGIEADYVAPAEGRPVFVLLHGLGAGRGEWSRFTALLAEKGIGSLALDARGHGRSGGPPYTTFRTPAAWAAIEGDIRAAVSYLHGKGFPSSRIVLGGASIGANLALRAAVREGGVPFVMLLSPGYDYQGIRIQEALSGLGRPVLLAAAHDDPYAFKTVHWARQFIRDRRSRVLLAASGHGVKMLEGERNQAFVRELMESLERLCPGGGAGVSAPTEPSSPF